MVNQEHSALLRRSIAKRNMAIWNAWREQYPLVEPDLSKARLTGTYLRGADFSRVCFTGTHLIRTDLSSADLSDAHLIRASLKEADLTGADLTGANLSNASIINGCLQEANLSGADLINVNLHGANLCEANLSGANLKGANLVNADLRRANLRGANLSGANLSGANLNEAFLIHTNLRNANLTACSVYGTYLQDSQLEGATQHNLIITPANVPTISVDTLPFAQFIALLLKHQGLCEIIDIIAKKAVLILGSFPSERQAVLDVLQETLREYSYVPVFFDLQESKRKDLLETMNTLAHLSSFIIADLSGLWSTLDELTAVVPLSNSPLIVIFQTPHEQQNGQIRHTDTQSDNLSANTRVLDVHPYADHQALLAPLKSSIIHAAERKANRSVLKQKSASP